jgi:hypothetical protein
MATLFGSTIFIISRVGLILQIQKHELCKHFTYQHEKCFPFMKDKKIKTGEHCGLSGMWNYMPGSMRRELLCV